MRVTLSSVPFISIKWHNHICFSVITGSLLHSRGNLLNQIIQSTNTSTPLFEYSIFLQISPIPGDLSILIFCNALYPILTHSFFPAALLPQHTPVISTHDTTDSLTFPSLSSWSKYSFHLPNIWSFSFNATPHSFFTPLCLHPPPPLTLSISTQNKLLTVAPPFTHLSPEFLLPLIFPLPHSSLSFSLLFPMHIPLHPLHIPIISFTIQPV